MNARFALNWLGLSMLAVSFAAGQTTQPAAEAPELTPRQQDLLLQLSDAEANIQAINKALKITGYNVGVAYNQIDSNLKGNELMNRQGGGPVRWDEFYGKTAKDYPRTGFWYDRMDDHRPQQFKFVYKANNDQIAHAKAQIEALARNQQALLDRRRVHEDDQSRLWATLAWEQVKDREIEFRPLYRFTLKPAGPDAAVLAPVILFLRTAASVAHDGLDSIQSDQSAVFQSGSHRMDAAYTALEQSMADALDASGLKPDRAKEGQALKALCKGVAEQSKVIADDYANALDRDKAKEDDSKLQFRGQLQSSLSSFATEFGNLNEQIAGTAARWDISADKATPAPEVLTVAGGATSVVKTIVGPATAPQSPAVQVGAKPAGTGPVVKVKYGNGDAEFDILKNGVKFFKDRKYILVDLPDELAGLTFAKRSVLAGGTVAIDCPAGAAVYAMVDMGDDAQLAHPAHVNFDQAMASSGWARLKDNGTFADKYHHFAIYKAVFSQPKHLVIPGIHDDQGGIRSGGITVASANLQ